MKTVPLDFALSTASLIAIGTLAWGVTGLAVPLSRMVFGEYHVVVDVLVLILGFGLVTAMSVRILLRLWPLSPGDYSMDDPVFTRWKVIVVLSEFGRSALRPFTTEFSKPLIARMFGAKIGADTALADG